MLLDNTRFVTWFLTVVCVFVLAGQQLAYDTLGYNGAWEYIWRFSGWDRRGRFPGYSTLIRIVKERMMAGHEGAYFYLLTYAHNAGLSVDAARLELHGVIVPVLQRVRNAHTLECPLVQSALRMTGILVHVRRCVVLSSSLHS